MLLGLLPLLKVVNALIKFAQGKDVFIYGFVAIVEIYQAKLYMMYSNPSNNINMSISKCFQMWRSMKSTIAFT
jgi:hypothetical protein